MPDFPVQRHICESQSAKRRGKANEKNTLKRRYERIVRVSLLWWMYGGRLTRCVLRLNM